MKNRFARMMALVLTMILSLSAAAFADTADVEGDPVGPENGVLALGEVCLNQTVAGSVKVVVKRTGNYGTTNVFKNSSTLTLATSYTSPELSLATSIGAATLPSNWQDAKDGQGTIELLASPITLTPVQAGAYTGSVSFTVTGTSSKDNQPLSRSATLAVTATVSDCTPPPAPDTTPPVITVVSPNLTVYADTAYGATSVDYSGNVSATDDVDGAVPVTCTPLSGNSFPMGATQVSCTASDNSGNQATAYFTVTVVYKGVSGFYAPVRMDAVNRVKAGSTVPLKFNVLLADDSYVSDSYVVKAFSVTKLNACGASLGEDIAGETAGSTELRYDLAGQQFIQNWKTPSAPGCYKATIKLQDNQTITATFETK